MGWLSGWSYRRAVTIDNQTGSELTDFQVSIDLDSSKFDFSKAASDGSDIRFTTDDGTTEIPYWIEKWDSQNQEATIWVKVPSIPANGSTTIYMYYGNPSATDASDGDAVFEFFDDFEGSSLDASKWNTYNYTSEGACTISNGAARLHDCEIISNTYTITDGVMEAKVKIEEKEGSIFARASANTNDAFAHSYGLSSGSFGSSSVWNLAITKDIANQVYDTTEALVGEWLLLRFTLNGTNVRAERYKYADMSPNGSVLETTLTGHDSGYIGLRVYGYSTIDHRTAYYDWVRVRKYADPEPTASVGAEELPQVWMKGWHLYRDITVTNNGTSDVTDGVVVIELDSSNFDFSRAHADGKDILVTADDDTTVLPYHIAVWDADNQKAVIVVRLKDITVPAGQSVTVRLWYNNPNATETQEDPEQVYDLWDDFDGSALDTTKWVDEVGNVSVSNGVLSIAGGAVHMVTSYPLPGLFVALINEGNNNSAGGINFKLKNDSGDNLTPINVLQNSSEFVRYMVYVRKDLSAVKYGPQGWGTDNADPAAVEGYGRIVGGFDNALQADWAGFANVAADLTIAIGSEGSAIIEHWSYRVPITVSNSGSEELTDFQVKVVIDTQTPIGAGKMNSDGSDIRFTASDGKIVIPHWVEDGLNSTTTTIWVKVPHIPANGTTTIYMCYGQPAAQDIQSGDAVFEFFDDFNGDSLDISKWTVQGQGTYSISSSAITLTTSSTGAYYQLYSENTFTPPFAVATRMRDKASGLRAGEFGNDSVESKFVNANNVVVIFGNENSEVRANAKSNRIWKTETTVSPTLNNPQRMSMYITTSDVTFVANEQSQTYSVSMPSLYVGLYNQAAYGTGSVTFDWIFVRKYASPEPTTTNGSEEEITQTQTYETSANADAYVVFRTEVSNTADARILKTTVAVNNAYARIKATFEQTNSADARVKKTSVASNSAKAYILVGNVVENAATASVKITREDYRNARADVLITYENGLVANARVVIAHEDSNTADAKVIFQPVVSNSAKARVVYRQSLQKEAKASVKTPFKIISNMAKAVVKFVFEDTKEARARVKVHRELQNEGTAFVYIWWYGDVDAKDRSEGIDARDLSRRKSLKRRYW